MSSTRKSVCIDCVLFTLKDKPVKENKYISIFLMWLSVVSKHAGLTAHDAISLKIDKPSFDHLSNHLVFISLVKKAVFQLCIMICPVPSTLREGMMMKYVKNDYTQDIYMYCDIDVLIVKPLTLLVDKLIPNTIYVHAEGLLSNENYGAAFTKEELATLPVKSNGFSAGKFFIYGKELYTTFMKTVHHVSTDDSKHYYTIEQPIFNKALYYLDKGKYNIDVTVLTPKTISINLHHYLHDTAILIDAMGIPGDGDLHFEKVSMMYILIQSDGLDTL